MPQSPLVFLIDPAADREKALKRFLGRLQITIARFPAIAAALQYPKTSPRPRIGVLSSEFLANGKQISELLAFFPRTAWIFLADPDAKIPTNGTAVSPADLGDLLLKIKELLNAPAPTPQTPAAVLPAGIIPCDFSVKLEYSITDMSVTGLGLRMSFAPPRGTVLVVNSQDICKKLNISPDTAFHVRVLDSRAIDPGKSYIVGSEFIALPATLQESIRAVCRRG